MYSVTIKCMKVGFMCVIVLVVEAEEMVLQELSEF